MKILAITCMHNRPNVSRIFLEGMDRLGVPVLAGVSDHESAGVCWTYQQQRVWVVNNPLGNKWNEVATAALAMDWTHLLISGDDNLYHSDMLTEFARHPTANYQGLSKVTFIHPATKRASELTQPNEPPIAIGTGRLLSRVAVMSLVSEGRVYLNRPTLNRELDHSQDMLLMEKGFYPIVFQGRSLCIDIKTNQNIWSFDNFTNNSVPVDYEKSISWLSLEEQRLINTLA